jgi:putative endonuclease
MDFSIFAPPNTGRVAQMAKLVDALCSGRSAGNGVLVRIQFWALRPGKCRGFFMTFFVYILFSAGSDKFYIGQTNNVAGRLRRHNAGTEKATQPYVPWELCWFIEKPSRSEAMALEKKLKNLSKERLRKFIEKYKSAGPDESGR